MAVLEGHGSPWFTASWNTRLVTGDYTSPILIKSPWADWHPQRIALSVQQLPNSFNSSKSGGMRNSWISSTMMNNLQYLTSKTRRDMPNLHWIIQTLLLFVYPYTSRHAALNGGLKSKGVFLPLVPNFSTHTIFH